MSVVYALLWGEGEVGELRIRGDLGSGIKPHWHGFGASLAASFVIRHPYSILSIQLYGDKQKTRPSSEAFMKEGWRLREIRGRQSDATEHSLDVGGPACRIDPINTWEYGLLRCAVLTFVHRQHLLHHSLRHRSWL